MSRPTRTVLAALVALVAVGCAAPTMPAPTATPVPSGFIDLPTLSGIAPSVPPGAVVACGGVGFSDSVVHGSAAEDDPVWLERVDRPGARVPVRWPAGFRARFSPALELLDGTGALVAREGQVLRTVGGQPGADGRFEVWEFDRRSYPCY